MNINKLKESDIREFKNYKVACEFLEEEVKSGKSKKLQLEDWTRYFDYHKEGNKIIIDNIYETEKDKVDNRKEGNNHKLTIYDNLNIKVSEYQNNGIYIIQKDNDVYIGSTVQGFRKRFQQHYNSYDGNMKHTYNLLHNGGEFSILHDMSDVEDVELIRMVESEAIKMYLLDPRYNVINKYESSISFNNKYKKKLKNIKISEDKYYEAIQLLVKKGLLDEEGVEL